MPVRALILVLLIVLISDAIAGVRAPQQARAYGSAKDDAALAVEPTTDGATSWRDGEGR